MGDDELPLGAHHRRSRQHFRGRRAPTIVEIASAIVSGAGRSRAGWHCRGRRAPSDRSTLSRAPGAYGRTWPTLTLAPGAPKLAAVGFTVSSCHFRGSTWVLGAGRLRSAAGTRCSSLL